MGVGLFIFKKGGEIMQEYVYELVSKATIENASKNEIEDIKKQFGQNENNMISADWCGAQHKCR